MRPGLRSLALGALLALAPCAQAQAPEQSPPLSSAAERVFELAKPRILQIRTLLQVVVPRDTGGAQVADRAIVVLLCEFIDERQLASAFYEHLANAMEWEKDITHSRRRSR